MNQQPDTQIQAEPELRTMPYAINQDQIVHADDATHLEQPQFHCPKCHQTVHLQNGASRSPAFSHPDSELCSPQQARLSTALLLVTTAYTRAVQQQARYEAVISCHGNPLGNGCEGDDSVLIWNLAIPGSEIHTKTRNSRDPHPDLEALRNGQPTVLRINADDSGATTGRRRRGPAAEGQTIILVRSVQNDGDLPGLEHEFKADSAINLPQTCGICLQIGMPLQDERERTEQEKKGRESRIQERLAALSKLSNTQEDEEDEEDEEN